MLSTDTSCIPSMEYGNKQTVVTKIHYFKPHGKATDDDHLYLADESKAGEQNKKLNHMKNHTFFCFPIPITLKAHEKSRPSHPSAGNVCMPNTSRKQCSPKKPKSTHDPASQKTTPQL